VTETRLGKSVVFLERGVNHSAAGKEHTKKDGPNGPDFGTASANRGVSPAKLVTKTGGGAPGLGLDSQSRDDQTEFWSVYHEDHGSPKMGGCLKKNRPNVSNILSSTFN